MNQLNSDARSHDLLLQKVPNWAVIQWVFFPAIYYLIQSDPRYRYAIYWTSLLPAGCALTEALLKMPFLQAAPGRSAGQPPAIPESTGAHRGAATQICSSVENSGR
jgi:hypothetical protein